MSKNYVCYHLHSDLSSCVTSIDSVTKPIQYIKKAQECGMSALAFSEHGSVFSWVKKKEQIEAAGMKYIHAAEFYLTETTDEKIRDNYHCILIAKNYDGVLELNKLSSVSFNRNDGHFYFVPRITLEELYNTSDNIIVTSACLGGALSCGTNDVKRSFLDFLKNNKHRCFLEIQHHIEDRQIAYNKYLYKISQKYNIPLIAGTDTHALNQDHLEGRSVLQKAKNIHFAEEDAWDLTFKTYDELVDAYKKQNSLQMDVILEAINNTCKMADMVEEFDLDRSYKYPHLWENSDKLFIKKIKEGIKRRGVDKYPNRDEYAERIKYELKAYRHNQAIDFMLLMEDIIAWCRTQDIPVGYGRGSVNGSVIAWLLGITEMDSIKHKLNFDRFMNVERVSLSDIDTDFPPSRINDVKNYIFNRHGLYCSDIATFNTIADKGAIRDVCRALYSESGDYLTLSDQLCNAVDNEDSYQSVRNEYPEVFKYVDMLKGVVVSVGNHPCGVITAPFSIDDKLGLFSSTTDSFPISQVYMKEVDGLNYVKLDCLKLDTIELISNTCKLANIPMVTPDNLDITDINVWNSMRDDTTQIFQWEGKTGDNYIKKLLSDKNINSFKKVNKDLDRMTLLSIGNSAIRPAGASYRDDLANGIVRKSGSEAIDDFLKPTFGYLVFQCQIIDFLHEYCGFTMGEADVVRRHFAKKTGTEDDIPKIKSGFIATMKEKYNMSKKEAEDSIVAFLKVIEDASKYLFSINHSQPYSYEGYASGWLRYYYPTEFLTCALNINQDNEDKTIGIIEYAKKVGVVINPIKYGFSKSEYSCDPSTKTIYKGLSSIKYMSNSLAEELYALKDTKYNDFIDLLIDINKKTSCNSRQLDILTKLNFFSEFGDVNTLLTQIDIFNKLYGKKQVKKTKLDYPEYLYKIHCSKETDNLYKFDDINGLIKDICSNTTFQDTSIIDNINYELECLGYIQTIVPKLKDSYNYVVNIKDNIITLYQLNSGISKKIKCRKNTIKTNPIKQGDMIKVLEIADEPRWYRDSAGDWQRNYDDLEPILKKYKILSN